MIEVESERVTTRKEGPKKNGSYNLGLFQINDMDWCRKSVRGGDCNMKCSGKWPYRFHFAVFYRIPVCHY